MPAFSPFIPKGQINIYRFVPLDETYTNTLHFKTRQDQLNYFGCTEINTPTAPTADTIMKLQYSGQTFTRNERQYIRIEANACNLYDCNYMAFQNRDFGSMWFFAFIHSVEYINNQVSEVEFELDVMQSFMWNYELRECYVVREHSLTDYVGDNLIGENIIPLVYKNAKIEKTPWFDEYVACAITAFDTHPFAGATGSNKYSFKTVLGMPLGGDLRIFDMDKLQGVTSDYLSDNVRMWVEDGGLDGIATIFIYPKTFAPSDTRENRVEVNYTVNKPTNLNGYQPINYKLLTYPYTFLMVDCGSNTSQYRFEFFSTSYARFLGTGVMSCTPQIELTPTYYDGNEHNGLSTDHMNSLIMGDFPNMFFAGDNFANWWGQNGTSWAIRTVFDVAQLAAGLGMNAAQSGNALNTFAYGSASGLGGDLATFVTNYNLPTTPRCQGSANAYYSSGQLNFYFKTIALTSQCAKIVDDFFTMYGYATHEVKVPNIRFYDTCRKHFNYLKCGAMSFHWEEFKNPEGEGKGTSVPQKYMKRIIEIYQKGITFWKNPDEVGRYDTLKADNVPNERGYR